MVVVPTEENVVLEFEETWAESGGKIASLVGVVVLLGALLWGRRYATSNERRAMGQDPRSGS
jgi:hypothetical protein